jgi:galactose mutarotase-like enzyme
VSAHVGFGLHPGFAAATFESFTLEMPVGIYRRHLAPDNFLSGETQDIAFAGGEMPFAREKLPGSYILELLDVKEQMFVYRDAPSHREMRVELAGCPYLTLWSNGDSFLCLEPCWGLTDHHDQRAFEKKEGIQEIAPGGELRASFTMQPGFLP